MLRSWEGNPTSGVALVMRHRLCGLYQLQAQRPNTWFPSLSCRFRIRFRNRFRKKTVSVTCRCCWDVCAAIARQAQEAGRWVSRAKEWVERQARTNRRYGKIELDPIWTDQRQRRTYGNGERYFFA